MWRDRRPPMRAAPWRPGVWRSLLEKLSSMVSASRSIENESEFAVVFARRRLGFAGGAVDSVKAPKQHGGLIVGIGEAVVGPRQLLLRHRSHDVRCYQHHQLGLVIDV